ncbi:hypothetical protein GUITHDRAFT_143240 [Guillardia theta CCMP2712]|uniref:Uncharacterized protein n=1 Tax=Guillardia theta (strain CCMP2712) TaxID=905079 RepID=L1IUE3_GUITC|nr:hypothetical protein GUITHDRAFT_143240 [Guillardia theta CCMP2712]EKX39866.1 hypothetical protein GUITHDRAFT_143240 [Guillardia theta CCMP2712]|eukprot:XP_005826846.1 hypothetical protein GUITHDRAFT_143240 [Guillardia theta CCMP2712]
MQHERELGKRRRGEEGTAAEDTHNSCNGILREVVDLKDREKLGTAAEDARNSYNDILREVVDLKDKEKLGTGGRDRLFKIVRSNLASWRIVKIGVKALHSHLSEDGLFSAADELRGSEMYGALKQVWASYLGVPESGLSTKERSSLLSMLLKLIMGVLKDRKARSECLDLEENQFLICASLEYISVCRPFPRGVAGVLAFLDQLAGDRSLVVGNRDISYLNRRLVEHFMRLVQVYRGKGGVLLKLFWLMDDLSLFAESSALLLKSGRYVLEIMENPDDSILFSTLHKEFAKLCARSSEFRDLMFDEGRLKSVGTLLENDKDKGGMLSLYQFLIYWKFLSSLDDMQLMFDTYRGLNDFLVGLVRRSVLCILSQESQGVMSTFGVTFSFGNFLMEAESYLARSPEACRKLHVVFPYTSLFSAMECLPLAVNEELKEELKSSGSDEILIRVHVGLLKLGKMVLSEMRQLDINRAVALDASVQWLLWCCDSGISVCAVLQKLVTTRRAKESLERALLQKTKDWVKERNDNDKNKKEFFEQRMDLLDQIQDANRSIVKCCKCGRGCSKIVLACGHAVTCETCELNLDIHKCCPYCGGNIDAIKRIFIKAKED